MGTKWASRIHRDALFVWPTIFKRRYFPWQRLYFLPLLQGHLALRPIFPWSVCIVRFSLQKAQVQAVG